MMIPTLMSNLSNFAYLPSSAAQNLRVAITTLDTLLYTYSNPEWEHSRLVYYKQCPLEDVRFCYRLTYDKVCSIMRKELVIRDIAKSVFTKQKELKQKMQSEPNNFQQKQKDLVMELRKVGTVKKQDEQYFRQNNFSPELQNIMISCNRTIIKFQYLWNAMRTYQMDQNRPFTEYLGEEGLKQFQTLQLSQLCQFEENIKKKGKVERLKNTFNLNTVNKDLLLIQKTLEMMENVKNLSELEKLLLRNKIEANHHKIYVQFLNNSTKLIKLQKIVQNLKNCIVYDTENLSNMLSQIECDVHLSRKNKLDLLAIGERIEEHYKCSKAFTQMNLPMTYDTVNKLFGYLGDLGKMLKFQILEIEQKNRKQRGQNMPINNEKQKLDIFNLCQYFQKLIQLIIFQAEKGNNQPANGNEKYLKSEKQKIRQVIDLKDQICTQLKEQLANKEEEIKLLKWRVFNLNDKISKLQNEQLEMLQRMNRESVYGPSDPNQDFGYITQPIQIQVNIDVEVQTENIAQQQEDVDVKQIERLREQVGKKQEALFLKEKELQVQKQKRNLEKLQFDETVRSLKQKIDTLTSKQVAENLQEPKQVELAKLNSLILQQKQENQLTLKEIITRNQQLQRKYQILSDDFQAKDKDYQNICLRQQELINQIHEMQNQKPLKSEDNLIVTNQFYFFGQIFEDFRNPEQQKHKLSLVKAIQSKIGKEIYSTKLIYKLDEKNAISPHLYIDNVKNWVAMFKLKNGQIIGAFCQDNLQFGKKSNVGFLFNLNLSKFYNLKKNDKAKIYQYDEFYLIIGNSQIRYRFHTKVLESCFGFNYKFFETEKDTAVTFFGQSVDNLELETFQFYQVNFNETL